MSIENLIPKTEIKFYGKKAFYLDKNLARKVEPEQIRMNFLYEEIEDKSSNTIH
jgi:hypothetical protein